ncbi:hypothetical protein SMACR_01834 [Sordaria macrospora]|uniref:WGS project CABT00000000 data, contig 2.5 n=2 Tax=Sordaria macrospora TaxID=5147 RepID=F7VS00_SORMK|nr:uncharacterized protein SMAC_01834 [Sordaria macrospora k-hell]KAA8636529.1 hypothetical protein SMACR_01834 [Sordaria macrospora]WPJ61527.1 hypothetical protein SMAC4_01834 [Sordaria macrospora]CCC08286.1 unnamed protein product [Sordaria macrospora k-hell]
MAQSNSQSRRRLPSTMSTTRSRMSQARSLTTGNVFVMTQRYSGSSPEQERKITRSLRPLSSTGTAGHDNDSQRQMQVDHCSFPRRRPLHPETPPLKPTTLDKFAVGIGEGIHGSITTGLDEFTAWFGATPLNSNALLPTSNGRTGSAKALQTFSQKNIVCRQVTQACRTCRSLEVIEQA